MKWLRLRRRVCGGLLAAHSVGCTPSSEPVWVLSRARELGLRLDLRAPGPYSADLEGTGPGTPSEFLPGDTAEITPIVAGPDGVIDPSQLQVLWFLCDDSTACLLRGTLGDAPDCIDEALGGPASPCRLGAAPTATLVLGEPPPPAPATGDEAAEAALDIATSWPFVGMIASTPDGPGAQACREALDERTSLEGCLLAERPVPLGPLSAVADVLGPLGYDVDFSESLGPLLQRPRNHNPDVTAFIVTVDGEATEVPVGATVLAPPGAQMLVQWLPEEGDVESFDIMLPEATVPTTVTESLSGRWYASEELDDYAPLEDGWALEFIAPHAAQTHLQLLLRDDQGSETSGWLTLESSAP